MSHVVFSLSVSRFLLVHAGRDRLGGKTNVSARPVKPHKSINNISCFCNEIHSFASLFNV